ncbi:MAG TPA: hypothetical protein VM889_13495 [Candidatus Thermoplasmatota archaeon]|nr:hypothetical protein [Candidatus Thermoplasmatota archaeon]
MDNKDLAGFVLDDKPVFDWNHVPIGTVADIRKDPKTRSAREIIVNVSPDARRRLGLHDELLEIPISYVFGIRRDAVTLDRSVQELRRFEVVSPKP